MAFLAAPSLAVIDPQTASQIIPISDGDNIQPLPHPATFVGAPVIVVETGGAVGVAGYAIG